MKFKSYISESMELDELYGLIERDCKPFIKDWKKLNTTKWLMSGRNDSNNPYKKKQVRKNRKPVDTPEDIHKFMDDKFKKMFGVKSRSNAIFCSFNPNLSDFFGELYLIFPIGKYKAVSSQKVEDLWTNINDIADTDVHIDFPLNKRTWKIEAQDWEKEEILDGIDKLIDKSKYTDKLVFHNNEIMVTCKEYYLVRRDFNGQLLKHFGAL